MVQQITIRSVRGTPIHAYINKPDWAKSRTLIIFVPGLLEAANTPLLERAASLFSEEDGFTAVRIDSASFYENGSLEETSIYAQVQDIENVISYFKLVSNRLVLVAHSMGAFVTLLTQSIVPDSLIMWDPSLHPRQIFELVTFDVLRNNYHDAQLERNISPTLMKELLQLPDMESVVRNAKCPVGIISAGKGALGNVDLYARHMTSLLGHTTIQNADHNFSTPQHLQRLVHETINLINKDRP